MPPELLDIEQAYWSAFWDLNGDRHSGGPIPWTAIKAYHSVAGVGDFPTFQRIINTMDGVYMKAAAEQQKQK